MDPLKLEVGDVMVRLAEVGGRAEELRSLPETDWLKALPVVTGAAIEAAVLGSRQGEVSGMPVLCSAFTIAAASAMSCLVANLLVGGVDRDKVRAMIAGATPRVVDLAMALGEMVRPDKDETEGREAA